MCVVESHSSHLNSIEFVPTMCDNSLRITSCWWSTMIRNQRRSGAPWNPRQWHEDLHNLCTRQSRRPFSLQRRVLAIRDISELDHLGSRGRTHGDLVPFLVFFDTDVCALLDHHGIRGAGIVDSDNGARVCCICM